MSTLAKRLHDLRETARISQRELGRLAGLKSERHVGLIENGERPNLEMKTIEALAGVLGSSVGYLSAGEGLPPSLEQVRFAVASATKRLADEKRSDVEADAPPESEPHPNGKAKEPAA